MKDILRRSYDRSAPGYDAEFRALQVPKYEALLGPRAERLPAGGPALDIGCGTGLLAEWLAAVGAPRRVVGVDLSAGMLALARARPAGIAAVQGDLERLPFRARSFAAAAAFTSMGIGRAPCGPALREAARVLRPGGALALSVLKESHPEDVERALRDAGFRAGPRVDCGQDWGWLAFAGG